MLMVDFWILSMFISCMLVKCVIVYIKLVVCLMHTNDHQFCTHEQDRPSVFRVSTTGSGASADPNIQAPEWFDVTLHQACIEWNRHSMYTSLTSLNLRGASHLSKPLI